MNNELIYGLIALVVLCIFVYDAYKHGIINAVKKLLVFGFVLSVGMTMTRYQIHAIENAEEIEQLRIQNNTETVLIDGKECVIYDDNRLFSSASISCDWDKQEIK